jgi:anti-sigma regulatory factor (Ser/Thr protein kinase)
MRDMSLHILDIAENSINAGASRIEITIEQDETADEMSIAVDDNGKGIDTEKKECDPYFTSKEGKRFGLGIPLLRQAAEECGGGFELGPRADGGTRLRVWFKRSHPDLKPLGDIGATVSTLLAGHPEIDYMVLYRHDGYTYRFDTTELRNELDGLALNVPQVLQYVSQDVNEGIRRTHG